MDHQKNRRLYKDGKTRKKKTKGEVGLSSRDYPISSTVSVLWSEPRGNAQRKIASQLVALAAAAAESRSHRH